MLCDRIHFMKTNNETSSSSSRLFALDFLRGADMVLLTVIGPLVWAINSGYALPDSFLYQFTHPWEGFTLWDIIMPLFLFMCGAAIPFSLEKRLSLNGGRPNAVYFKHVICRVALLWVLGMIVQGRLLEFNLLEIRPYNNTLQTIAMGYLVMAILVCTSMKWRIVVPLLGFVFYGLIVHFGGDYSMTGNIAEYCEQSVLTFLMPAGSKAIRELGMLGYLGQITEIGEIHYTWILTTPMFVFMTACGYFSARILLGRDEPKKRAINLAIFGTALLALGWILTFMGVKMVKHIFTVSFTAQAMGWSALALALSYLITDVAQFRRGASFFVLFGRTSLLAYMIGEWIWPCFMYTGQYVTHGLEPIVGKAAQGVVSCVFAICLLVFCLVIRRKYVVMKKEISK